MQNIPTQIDDSTELPADEFNQIPTESENAITASNIALSASDLTQLAKTISNHVGGADYYNDAGVKNAYVLTQILSFKVPTGLFVGLRVRFIPVNNSDSATVTLKLGSLAAVSVNYGKLANGGTPSVPLGYFDSGYASECVYQKTDDGLTGYWRLITQGWMVVREGENSSNASMWKNMQYMSSNPTLTPTANSCTFFHGAGRFYMVHGVYVYYLLDNKTWTAISTYFVDSALYPSVQTHDHLVFRTGSGDELRCFPVSGFTPLDVNPSGTSTVLPLASKFEIGGSDNFIVISSDIDLLYSTTGVSGTWVAPTTQPEAVASLCWHGGDTFIASGREGVGYANVYLSEDNCDNFVSVYDEPTTNVFISLLTSNRDQILLALFEDVGVESLRRSIDNGATWTQILTTPEVLSIKDIKFLDGKTWLITGQFQLNALADTIGAIISTDNGLTWKHVELEQGHISTNLGSNIGFDGNKIIYQEAVTGKTIKSLSV